MDDVSILHIVRHPQYQRILEERNELREELTQLRADLREYKNTADSLQELRAAQEEQLAQLRGERALWHSLKADTCRCGHSLIAHRGHGHAIGSPEPLHCSTLCGCGRFDPPALMEVLQAREREVGTTNQDLKDAVMLIRRLLVGSSVSVKDQASDWLKRKGFNGNVLRVKAELKEKAIPDPGDPESSHSA